jgi:hypothetical protein
MRRGFSANHDAAKASAPEKWNPADFEIPQFCGTECFRSECIKIGES